MHKDLIQNGEILLKIGVAPIDEKMKESYFRWFDHVQRKTINESIIGLCDQITLNVCND